MIKITRAKWVCDRVLELEFSDGTAGEYDLAPVLARDTSLTRPLRNETEFRRFFLDLGALCWPNGLELSPSAIHERLRTAGKLERRDVA